MNEPPKQHRGKHVTFQHTDQGVQKWIVLDAEQSEIGTVQWLAWKRGYMFCAPTSNGCSYSAGDLRTRIAQLQEIAEFLDQLNEVKSA